MLKEVVLILCAIVSQISFSEGMEMSSEELASLADRPTRIVGGEDAERGTHPWQVSLNWFNKKRGIKPRHVCGGTLIAADWVLTAGHCQTLSPKRPGGQYLVLAGKHELGRDEDTEQKRLVAETYVYPEYGGSVGPFDIALMKLDEPFNLNDYISTAALPYPDKTHDGDAILTGWGSIGRTRSPQTPEVLQAASLPLISFEECKGALNQKLSKGGRNPLHETNLCTGPLDGSASACKGDSGGPLVVKNSFDMVEVIGVVSWGLFPCGGRNAPSVYTKVSAFVTWIHRVMLDHEV